MVRCSVCRQPDRLAAQVLPVCGKCLRAAPGIHAQAIRKAHARSRDEFDLPQAPPRVANGVRCTLCLNACRIADGDVGFCSGRRAENGKLVGGEELGVCHAYYDPLPTNCVGMPWCGGVGERGTRNLAVFSQFCTFDCLFCQNWHFRDRTTHDPPMTPKQLAGAVDRQTTCICYFGGDPTPQLPFFLNVSRLARDRRRSGPLRICWETNGAMSAQMAEKMMQISLESGGCVKFDLKAWNQDVHLALCGVSSQQTRANFRRLAQYIPARPDPPPLIASTLLVPGYVDAEEVTAIARFIAHLDPTIPYALLAFYPQYLMPDLPVTSRDHALACLQAARDAGLTRVRLGNEHLLGDGAFRYAV